MQRSKPDADFGPDRLAGLRYHHGGTATLRPEADVHHGAEGWKVFDSLPVVDDIKVKSIPYQVGINKIASIEDCQVLVEARADCLRYLG